MSSNSILKLSTISLPALLVSGLLHTAPPAKAAESPSTCSNRTIRGDYGFSVEGTLAEPGKTLRNGAGLPTRGLSLTHFDGRGNLTQLDYIVVNGAAPPDWAPGTGTYTVNPDCTGTAVIYTPSNPTGPVSLHFVVVKKGREIHQVVDANAILATGIKVDPSLQ